MRLTSIAVIGGGPGGLYAARLLKLEHPHAQVDLYEQGVPDKTFGFGVGLAARTQRHLHDADSASFQAIADASYPHEMSMQVDGRVAQFPHGNLRAIARSTLFPERTHLPVAQLMLAYLTRAGKIDIEQVARNAPALARRSLADFAGVEARVVPESDLTEWILGQLASERTYLVAVTPEVSA